MYNTVGHIDRLHLWDDLCVIVEDFVLISIYINLMFQYENFLVNILADIFLLHGMCFIIRSFSSLGLLITFHGDGFQS